MRFHKKYRYKLPKRYRVPSEVLFLTAISAGLFVIISLCFFVCISLISNELSFADRLFYFPRYCIEYVSCTGHPGFDLALRVFRIFFFAALITVFYELYKDIVECRRINKIEKAIYNTFLWTSSRESGRNLKYVSWFKPFDTLKARFGYSEKEILQACMSSSRLRAANLATTRAYESYPHDRLVVECFMRNTPYGCLIDRGSKITIVVTSTSFGLSKFGFYLALFGGFNFVSKENTDHDTSERWFSRRKGDEDNGPLKERFITDANGMAAQNGSWVISLATIASRDGEKIALYHKKDSKEQFNELCSRLPQSVQGVKVQTDGDEFKVGGKNILSEIVEGTNADGFVLRISNQTLVWNPKRMLIIKELAEKLCGVFGTGFNEKALEIVKDSNLPGFPAEMFDNQEVKK